MLHVDGDKLLQFLEFPHGQHHSAGGRGVERFTFIFCILKAHLSPVSDEGVDSQFSVYMRVNG